MFYSFSGDSKANYFLKFINNSPIYNATSRILKPLEFDDTTETLGIYTNRYICSTNTAYDASATYSIQSFYSQTKCAESCTFLMASDNTCQHACNVEACHFDNNACATPPIPPILIPSVEPLDIVTFTRPPIFRIENSALLFEYCIFNGNIIQSSFSPLEFETSCHACALYASECPVCDLYEATTTADVPFGTLIRNSTLNSTFVHDQSFLLCSGSSLQIMNSQIMGLHGAGLPTLFAVVSSNAALQGTGLSVRGQNDNTILVVDGLRMKSTFNADHLRILFQRCSFLAQATPRFKFNLVDSNITLKDSTFFLDGGCGTHDKHTSLVHQLSSSNGKVRFEAVAIEEINGLKVLIQHSMVAAGAKIKTEKASVIVENFLYQNTASPHNFIEIKGLGATFVAVNNTFSNLTSGVSSVLIESSRALFKMCTFTTNQGRVISVTGSYSSLGIDQSSFEHNGGKNVLSWEGGGNLTIKNSNFAKNKVDGPGGAITASNIDSASNHFDVTVLHSLFSSNEAILTHAGAISAVGAIKISIEQSTFRNNKALASLANGGAVFVGIAPKTSIVPPPSLDIQASTFENNRCGGNGGSLFVGGIDQEDTMVQDVNVTISAVFFKSNQGFAGGAVALRGYNVVGHMLNNVYQENWARNDGGGGMLLQNGAETSLLEW